SRQIYPYRPTPPTVPHVPDLPQTPKTQSSQPPHHYLIFFCFSLILSSLINTPFPLYGSRFLHSPILPAKLITSSRLIPSSRIRVGLGVEAVTPAGTASSTGCV